MEFVNGESLSRLLRIQSSNSLGVPQEIAAALVAQVLHGLHAAHTATDEMGNSLGIVHRDVSPQNIMVSTAGVARLLDFGVAKARSQLHTTREGQIKGKLGYMAPEQLRGESVSPRSDIYAAGVVLWELLTGRRLFWAHNEAALVASIMAGPTGPASQFQEGISPQLDAIVMQALSKPQKSVSIAPATWLVPSSMLWR